MACTMLVGKGKQDVFLTGTPDRSFWYPHYGPKTRKQFLDDEYVGFFGPITYEEWLDEEEERQRSRLQTLGAVATMTPLAFILAPLALPYIIVRAKVDTLYFSFLRDYNEHWKNME